ncbi:unnamed protein product [Lactuca saligna]|uniref:Uncharacterized protein n=1 Tax=Lactuca saligna TaxID=75948 RepID=A0AA35YV65_LACSI|nr:unnamed protein product [Lactuca saligna]
MSFLKASLRLSLKNLHSYNPHTVPLKKQIWYNFIPSSLIWDRTLGLLERSRRSLGLPATPNAIIEEDPIMWIGLEIKAFLQNVGKSFCPNYVDWFGFEAADIPPRSADKSVLSKFLQTNPSDHTTFKLKLRTFLIRNGLSILFKEGPIAYKTYYLRAVYIRRKYENKQLSSSIYLSEAEPFLEQYAPNEEVWSQVMGWHIHLTIQNKTTIELKLCRSISYAAVAAHVDQTSRRKLAPFLVPLLLGMIQARPIAHDLFIRDSRYHILAWLKALEETRLKKK